MWSGNKVPLMSVIPEERLVATQEPVDLKEQIRWSQFQDLFIQAKDAELDLVRGSSSP